MIHFDTLAYARALKGAGVPGQQAEAHAEALRDIVTDEVATKGDLTTAESNLKRDIEVLRESMDGRFRLLQWMIGFHLALSVAVLWLLIRGMGV